MSGERPRCWNCCPGPDQSYQPQVSRWRRLVQLLRARARGRVSWV